MEEEEIVKINLLVENITSQLDAIKNILKGEIVDVKNIDIAKQARETGKEEVVGEERIIEGVFDGEKMIGPDGKQYIVPPNYASKSKLVEGDLMKLSINQAGSFQFKQINPVERTRVIGVLNFNKETKQYTGKIGSNEYRLLTAPVTYFKGETGDEVIMLIPEDGISKWAAVENVIKKIPSKIIPEHNDFKKNDEEIDDLEI